LDEGAAGVLLMVAEAAVGAVGGAVAVDGFHDGGDGAKGCYDPAWMHGGVVGDVVEDAAEDYVVGEFVKGTVTIVDIWLGVRVARWDRAYGAA